MILSEVSATSRTHAFRPTYNTQCYTWRRAALSELYEFYVSPESSVQQSKNRNDVALSPWARAPLTTAGRAVRFRRLGRLRLGRDVRDVLRRRIQKVVIVRGGVLLAPALKLLDHVVQWTSFFMSSLKVKYHTVLELDKDQ